MQNHVPAFVTHGLAHLSILWLRGGVSTDLGPTELQVFRYIHSNVDLAAVRRKLEVLQRI